MVEASLSGIMPNVSGTQILNGVLWVMVVIVAVSIIGYMVYFYTVKKKYSEFEVTIFEKDSSGTTFETYDKAGIFVNKQTNLKLWFMKRLKKGLNPNEVPYVVAKNKKGKLVKHVYLEKIGVSQYRFLHYKIDSDGIKLKVGEEDVNWAAQDIETIKRQYGKESFLDKYGSYIAFIITIMIVMIILISLFNKFEVLQDVADSLNKVADRQLEIVQAMNNVTKSPALNQNVPIIVGNGVR